MTPIFSNSAKNLKSSVQNGTGTFVIEKQYLQWKSHVVFLISYMWCCDAYFVTNTSLWRHNDVIRVEIRVKAPHMRNQNNYIFDFMQICLFSVANTFIVFAFKYPQSLTIYGPVAENLNFFNYLSLCAILSHWDGVFTRNQRILCRKLLLKFLILLFLIFFLDAKFGHRIWRHNSSYMG